MRRATSGGVHGPLYRRWPSSVLTAAARRHRSGTVDPLAAAAESDASSPSSTLASRLTALLRQELPTKPSLGQLGVANHVDKAHECTSSLTYKTRYVLVECSTTLSGIPDVFTARATALHIASLHGRALRDSNVDLTNVRERCAPDADAILRRASVLVLQTTASVQQELFASIEMKLTADSPSGPVVLWGAAVYRLWVPAFTDDVDPTLTV